MPIYTYYCKSCLHDFELILPISEMNDPLGEMCPNCKEFEYIERMLSCPAHIDVLEFGSEKKKQGAERF